MVGGQSLHVVDCHRVRGAARDDPLGLDADQTAQLAGSRQLLDEFVGNARGVGRDIFLLVLAHLQELAFAKLVLIAFDVFLKQLPPRFFWPFCSSRTTIHIGMHFWL